MEDEKLTLKELRRRYLKNDNKFFIKIRSRDFIKEKKLQVMNNDKQDIVYYDGIKAFEVNNSLMDKVEISLPDNIYQLNASNCQKENIEDIISKIRDKINPFFKFKLSKITFYMSPASYLQNDKKNDANDILRKVLENIVEELDANNKYIYDGTTNKLFKDSIKRICDKFKKDIDSYKEQKKVNPNYYKKYSYTLLVQGNLDTINQVQIEKIFLQNCVFSRDKKYTGFARPKFDNLEKNKCVIENIDSLKKLEDILINEKEGAIPNYFKNTGDCELEKRYQHQFVISENTLQKSPEFEGLFRFDEEYYTREGKDSSDDRGRIDTIFVKIIGKVISEVYLIELKVDSSVIDGSNGLNKHFSDIKKLYSEENSNSFKEFKDYLKVRVSYVDQFFSNNELLSLSDNCKFYFYTIIALYSNDDIKNVLSKLNDLNDEEKIKNYKLPNDTTIHSYLETIPNSKVLIDKKWDGIDISKDRFIDITKKLKKQEKLTEDLFHEQS